MVQARCYLKRLAKKKELKAFCESNNVHYQHISNIANNRKNPSITLIRKLQTVIPPEWWFYEEDKARIALLNMEVAQNLKKECRNKNVDYRDVLYVTFGLIHPDDSIVDAFEDIIPKKWWFDEDGNWLHQLKKGSI